VACKCPKIHLLTVNHMESLEVVVFSCVIGGVLLVSVLTTLILYSRLRGVEHRQEATVHEMLKISQPKQLESAQAAAQSAQSMVQTERQEIAKFKDQIHGEMQRFYAIMSRNEKAVKKQESATMPSEDANTPPDEVDASSFNPEPPPGHEISKADLRALARKAGL